MAADGRPRFRAGDAGGTKGGAGTFFVGVLLLAAGGWLFLKSVYVTQGWYGLGHPLFGWGVPSGSLLIPLLLGVVLIFRDGGSIFGWLLFLAALLALILSILMSLSFAIPGISLLDLLLMVGMAAAGLGLILRSLRPSSNEPR
jgi:uncharacterized protein